MEYEQEPMKSDSYDAQKITQAEQKAIKTMKVKTPPSFIQSSSSTISKPPSFQFRMPVSKMDILLQSLKTKFDYNSNNSFNNSFNLSQSLQIHQNVKKYGFLHGLLRARPLKKRLSESSTAKQNRLI